MISSEMQIINKNDYSQKKSKDYSYYNSLAGGLINDKKNNISPKSKKKKIVIMSIIILIVIISLAAVYLFFKLRDGEDEEPTEQKKEFKKEDLVVNLNYKPNMIYRYILKKKISMDIEGQTNQGNSINETDQISDFFVLIKQENIEKNETNLIEKKWFSGYLGILNISVHYENNITQIINNEKLKYLLNGEDKENISYIDDLVFVKVDFYENGDIINFYLPNNNFSIINMQYIKEYSKLIFPKISSDLYTDSIDGTLNELIRKENKEEKLRKLNEKNNVENLNKINHKKLYRILSDNTVDDSQEFELEEYLSEPTEESRYYDLREKSNNSNITNLTEFSMGNIESKDVNLKNSEINKTTYSTINQDGFLESVTHLEKAIIINEENHEENISEIISNDTSDINFGIKSLTFQTINELKLIDNLTNEKIVNILFNSFQNITYELFNENYYNEYLSSLVKERVIEQNNLSNMSNLIESNDEIDKKNLRRTSSTSESYYGMTKLTNEKDLYNYNLLGLKMQKQIFNEFEPSTGKSSTYFNLVFGNVITKIKTSEQRSNSHIILKNKNQMAFNLIQLLYKTNFDLKQRNKNITQIIINFEKNILDSLKDYDYSNSFNECLDQVSNQLNTFASDLFDKLIILINNLYKNYTTILEDIKNDKYTIFKEIMHITKNEYINYIYEINNNLENFTNLTILFLESVEEEITNLNKIEKIDFLYDILDNIWESKLLLSQFNTNLFKAIEKGILTFKNDINEFKELAIGDLLYITDFLSVNIMKNEIIIRAYEEKTLKELSIKLKNFRNIIHIILDQLIDNINSEYEFEMSRDNNSLKFFSEQKALNQYNKVVKNSDNLVKKIREKINYNDIYEIYTSNIDNINYINNKTNIELINDIDDNFFKKINNLEPNYISQYNEYEKMNYSSNNQKNADNLIISFFDNETNILLNELRNVFNNSNIIYKKIIDDNYQLGLEYINELYTYIIDIYDENAYIGEGFYKKYLKFLNMYKENNDTERLFMNLEEKYLSIKNETFYFIKDNLFNIKFNEELNLNLSFISEQVDKCFNEENFQLFKDKLFGFYFNDLKNYIDAKNIILKEKFDYIHNNSKGIIQKEVDYFVTSDNVGFLKTNKNIDKINLDINYIYEFKNNKTEIIFNTFQQKIIDYLKEYYTKYIPVLGYNDIYYQTEKLLNLSKLITNEINYEINDINNYITNYTSKFQKENFFKIHNYLYKINNLFFDNESNFLFNELKREFNNTIEMHKKRIDENYKLALDYVDQLHLYIFDYHAGDNLDLGRGALEKYIRFITLFEEYVANANSESIYDNLKQNYEKIKNKIFNFVKYKLSNITEFYLGNDIYKKNFDFISRINNELFIISDRINQFFSEERFEYLKAEFFSYSLSELRGYNQIYNETFVNKFEYIRAHTDGIYDTPADYRYWYKTWYGHVKNRPNCAIPLTNNIDYVNINISHTIEYINNITDIIIDNFNSRIDEYLSKYIRCIQNLYDDLFYYIDEKINNNNNIQELFNKYEEIFIKILIFNSNNNIYENLKNETQLGLIYFHNLENNINLLTDDFLNSYYLNSYDTFLEYPKEILHKVKQFKDELIENYGMLSEKMTNISINKIINIIKTTNIFIEDNIISNQKYILIHINNNDIMKEYLTSKITYITDKFNNYRQKLSKLQNITLNLINNENSNNSEQTNNSIIYDLYHKLDIFINDLEYKINESFVSNECYNYSSNETNNTDLVCEVKKYKSNLSNYEYNYNIVKLRSGIFYTKTSLENIMNLLDDLDYGKLLNIVKSNNIEHKLNDKSILDIYNSSLNKLKEINENSEILLKEQDDYFYKEILDIYKINNDFYPFLKEFEKILKLDNNEYNNYLMNYLDSKFNIIEPLLYEFNNTLFEQKTEYLLYYIEDNNTFEEIYNEYQDKIKNSFALIKNEVLELQFNSNFLNSLRNYLLFKQDKKRNYFKLMINNISKEFNYRLLNITLNIGKTVEILLKKEYEELEFSLIYEYIKIFDLNINNFINGIILYISEIENTTTNKFKKIYYNFLEKLYFDEIDNNDYNNMKANYTKCLNYSMDLINETLIEDEINYEKYLNFLKNSSLNETENEKLIFINKTEILIDCINNNYYNYSFNTFSGFEKNYEMKLNGIIDNISKINMGDMATILSYNYFEKYFELDNYTQPIEVMNDIYYKIFLAYDDIILYINYTQNTIYFDSLYNLLIGSFKPSYINYINNFLVPPLVNNINIFINNKIEIHLNYLINKIKNEYNYYILMLNDIKEIGKSSKETLIYLYEDIHKKLEQYIYYTIDEYILFHIDLFYRNNKYIFRDNYIAYYLNEFNSYNIEIYQLKEYIGEIIYDGKFNKTLDEYSKELFNQLIMTKLNDTINDILYIRLDEIYLTIDKLKEGMNNILSNIEINEESMDINNMVNNYNIILKNQNNKFTFKVSETPIKNFYSFIKNVLEPPLLEIKLQYNIIENEILEKILNITNDFPDFSNIIKDKLAIDDILELIKSLIENFQYLLLKYDTDINNDYDSYINKLIHYTYINGFSTYDKPCKYSFCLINISQIKNQINERNINNQKNITLNDTKINNTKYYNKKTQDYNDNTKKNSNIDYIKKLLVTETKYDETMGAISKDEIIPFLLDIRDTIFELNNTYINNFDVNGKMKINIYISKINTTYKVKLKNTILKSASKFSSILSRESYEELLNNMLQQYFKIENYLNNITIYLEKDVNKLIEILTNSSNFISLVNDLSYDKMIGYFDYLTEAIQNKYELFSDNNNLRNLKSNDDKDDDDDEEDIDEPYEIEEKHIEFFMDKFGQIKSENNKFFVDFVAVTENIKINIEGFFKDICMNKGVGINDFLDFEDSMEASMVFHKNKIRKIGYKDVKEKNLLNLQYPIIFFLPVFPNLQLRIIPQLNINIRIEMGFELDLLKNDFSVYFEPSGSAEVGVNLEIGFYLPPVSSCLEISLTVGIKGTLGSGRVGVKLSLSLTEAKFIIEAFYEFNALSFSFYVLFRIKINLGIIKFSFSFYLIYKELFGGFTTKKKEKIEVSLKKIKDLIHVLPVIPHKIK